MAKEESSLVFILTVNEDTSKFTQSVEVQVMGE